MKYFKKKKKKKGGCGGEPSMLGHSVQGQSPPKKNSILDEQGTILR